MIDFMKRVINYLFSSMVLIALAGCQTKEMDMQINDSPDAGQKNVVWKEVVISASLEGSDVDTRTQRGVDKKTYWSPGDKIKIFSAGESSEFTSINTQPERVVKFKGLISFITGTSDENEDAKDYVWGLYPFSEDATYAEPDGISRTAEITTTLPSMQTAKAGTYDDGFAITIGRSETLSIPFYSAHSGFFVRFNRDDIISVTLRTVAGEPIAGRVTIGLDSNGKPVIKEHLTPSSQIVLYSEDGTPFETGKDYYIITLPLASAASGITFTVRTSGGLEGSYTMTSNKGFTRGSFRNLSDPLDVRIENPDNIANGISTGWGDPSPTPNEIWYTTSDDSDLSAVYQVDGETGNVVDIDNSEAPSASNGHKGVIRFTAPLTEVDESALREQDKLTSVTLPNSVVTIKEMAFDMCENLTEANLGTDLKEIMGAAFRCCGLISITLPEGLERLGHAPFDCCLGLTSVTIPSTVQVLGSDFGSTPSENPFAGCSNLSDFDGAFATADGKALVQTIGSVTYFVSLAYGRMGSQDTYILPNVQVITAHAFSGAPIGNVVLPETLRHICQYAFLGCVNLTSLTIPSSVQRIDKGAFENCSSLDGGLEWIRLNCTALPETNYNGSSSDLFSVFAGSFCPIYVPANLLEAYKTTEPWSDYEGRYMVADREIRFTTNDPDAVNTLLEGYKADGTHGVTDFWVDGLPPEPGMWVVDSDPPYSGAVYFNDDLTEVPDGFFEGMSSILSVEILSDQVTRIGNSAFKGTGIQDIVLPASVTEIGSDAFHNCSSLASFSGSSPLISTDGRCLITSDGYLVAFAGVGLEGTTYSIPEGVTLIQDMNSAPFKSVIVPSTIGSIGGFGDCDQLETIELPSSVTSFAPYAFYGCDYLRTVYLHGTSFMMIPAGVFESCQRLESVFIDATTPPYIKEDPVEGGTFGYGPTLCNNYFKVYVPASAFDTYKVASGWSYLYSEGHLAAYRPSQANNEIWYTVIDGKTGRNVDFRSITDVYDPGEQESIEYDEVNGVWVATFLFDLPAIPDQAFQDESDLKTIILPASVTSIGDDAFASCSNLESVTFPDGLQTIGENAFYYTKLSEVILPEGLTAIGNSAFGDCGSLVTVSLPASYNLESAEDIYPFDGSHSFSSFTGSCPMIAAGGRGLVDSEGRLFALAVAGLERITYSIPQGVVTIATVNQAGFRTVIIPNTVTVIDKGAFYRCPNLESVTVPLSVVDIQDSAFENCANLQLIAIPSSVQLIRNYAFKGCTGLKSVFMESATPPQLYANGQTFDETNDTFKIWVPAENYNAYYSATGWSNYRTHLYKRFTEQADNQIWFTVIDGKTGNDISFETLLYQIDPEAQETIDYNYSHDVWVASFPFDLTSIPGDSFFEETDLLTITLPDGVTAIGDRAFKNCTNLNQIALKDPESLISLGENSLENCSSLTSIGDVDAEGFSELPGLTTLKGFALNNCGITKLRLPVMTTVQQNAFAGCKLTNLDLPEVTSVQTAGFTSAYQLSGLNLPKLTYYGYGPFPSGENFKTLEFGSSITDMSHNLFQNTRNNTVTTLTLYVSALTPPTVTADTFKQVNPDTGQQLLVISRIYVHSSCESMYESAWADALACALPDGMTVYQVIQPM